MSTKANRIVLIFGGNALVSNNGTPMAIDIDDEEVLWIERSTDGRLLLSALIYSAKGFLIAQLMDNVWVHPAKHKAPFYLDDDVPNEIKLIKKEGGHVIFSAAVDSFGRAVVQQSSLHGKNGTFVSSTEGSLQSNGVTMTGNVVVGSSKPFKFGSGSTGIG